MEGLAYLDEGNNVFSTSTLADWKKAAAKAVEEFQTSSEPEESTGEEFGYGSESLEL